MNVKALLVSIGSVALVATFGCSGTPSMADAQTKFERTSTWAEEVDAGAVKVKSFDKIDALVSEVGGVKRYTMGYKVEMECTAPVFIIEGPADEYEVHLDNAENADFKRQYQGSYYTAQRIFVKEMKAGDVDTRTGTVVLTLYEKGWK